MESELPDWKDATSYSQGERGKRPPDAWDIVIEGIRVWVGSGHRYHPGKWVMHCLPLDIDSLELGDTEKMSAVDAQRIAMDKVAVAAEKRAENFLAFARTARGQP